VDVLSKRNVSYFVEDRLETCFSLYEAGVTPILFKQPWNRRKHPFMEVSDWRELESLIGFK
jgi:5'(3')-deoxyribonucleotidase